MRRQNRAPGLSARDQPYRAQAADVLESWLPLNIHERREAEEQWQDYQDNNNSASYLDSAVSRRFQMRFSLLS
jgi:hypothetical protein